MQIKECIPGHVFHEPPHNLCSSESMLVLWQPVISSLWCSVPTVQISETAQSLHSRIFTVFISQGNAWLFLNKLNKIAKSLHKKRFFLCQHFPPASLNSSHSDLLQILPKLMFSGKPFQTCLLETYLPFSSTHNPLSFLSWSIFLYSICHNLTVSFLLLLFIYLYYLL